jgi:hypothetical protein
MFILGGKPQGLRKTGVLIRRHPSAGLVKQFWLDSCTGQQTINVNIEATRTRQCSFHKMDTNGISAHQVVSGSRCR